RNCWMAGLAEAHSPAREAVRADCWQRFGHQRRGSARWGQALTQLEPERVSVHSGLAHSRWWHGQTGPRGGLICSWRSGIHGFYAYTVIAARDSHRPHGGCSRVLIGGDRRWIYQSRVADFRGLGDIGALFYHTHQAIVGASFAAAVFLPAILCHGRLGGPRNGLMQRRQPLLGIILAVHEGISGNDLRIGGGCLFG